VLVTGPVGGSIQGRHLELTPRIAAGRALHDAGVRAMMDVSDGLALDLDRMARLSGVAILLEHVPLHADASARSACTGRTPLDHALHDGEDHELLACAPAAVLERFLASPAAGAAVRIGRVEATSSDRPAGLLLPDPAGGVALPFDPHDPRAFVHGR
jgi:thiamine-monophosphate kinase